MNHTRAALLALLLPFSGYAITKEERIKQIHKEARVHIWNNLHNLMYLIWTYQFLDLSKVPQEEREAFLSEIKELKIKMDALNKEYNELEQA